MEKSAIIFQLNPRVVLTRGVQLKQDDDTFTEMQPITVE